MWTTSGSSTSSSRASASESSAAHSPTPPAVGEGAVERVWRVNQKEPRGHCVLSAQPALETLRWALAPPRSRPTGEAGCERGIPEPVHSVLSVAQSSGDCTEWSDPDCERSVPSARPRRFSALIRSVCPLPCGKVSYTEAGRGGDDEYGRVPCGCDSRAPKTASFPSLPSGAYGVSAEARPWRMYSRAGSSM